MAPPELAADRPVADVLQPPPVLVGPAGGVEPDRPVVDDRERLFGERLHRDVPLRRQQRLDDGLRPRRDRDRVRVVFRLDELAGRLQVGHDPLAGDEAVEPGVRAALVVQRPVEVHERDGLEPVPLADGVVVLVVARRHLEGALAEVHLDVLVGDDGDDPADRRHAHRLAHERREPWVVGVDGDGGVGRDRLGPRRRDVDVLARLRPARVHDRVADGPQRARPLDVVDLLVRDDRLVVGVPVDEVVAAVDEALGVEADEHLLDGAAEAVVHREPLVAPVARVAEAALLLEDDAAVLLLPRPDVLEERLAAQRFAVDALLFQLPLDDVLGRDAGVVHAGNPERLEAAHPLVAREEVLDRVLERVAHVEPAGHVRRRHGDHERGRPALGHRVRVGVEKAAGLPVGVPLLLDGGRLVRRPGRLGGRRFGGGRRGVSVAGRGGGRGGHTAVGPGGGVVARS